MKAREDSGEDKGKKRVDKNQKQEIGIPLGKNRCGGGEEIGAKKWLN